MHTPIRVTFVGLASSRALENAIVTESKVLDPFEDEIIRRHVYLEREAPTGAPSYRADVFLTLRGGDVITTRGADARESHESVQAALRDTFNRALAQLVSRRRLRPPVHRSVGGAARDW